MQALYIASILFVLGFGQVQPIPTDEQPIFIEDARKVSGGRVVAGWEAEDGQIPHQVSVRMVNNAGGVSSCGGSVIHHNWVMTAAHCVANRNIFVVRFGLTNLTRPQFIIESNRKYIHPGYNEIQAGVQTDDIALIGMDQHIPYGPYIQPCRLQNSGQKNINYDRIRLTVSGYGLTDDSWNGVKHGYSLPDKAVTVAYMACDTRRISVYPTRDLTCGASSEVLRWVFLFGISNEECLSWYPNSQVIREQTICAAYYNDTAQSSCQGDSGGPLTVVDEDGDVTMVGVVSFGSTAGCNSPFPAGYVRPGHYHDWFLDVTGINFDWNSEDLRPVAVSIAEEPTEIRSPNFVNA